MKVFGYCRVSSKDQNLERQIEAVKEFAKKNYKVDLTEDEKNQTLFCDKISGKNFDRPQWNKLADSNVLREGDVLIVKELDRLGRNKEMILEVLKDLKGRGVIIKILDIPTTLVDFGSYDNDIAKNMMDMVNNVLIEVLSTIAEQERVKIKKRQAEGIEIAKAQGKYKGRQPLNVDKLPKNFKKLYTQWKDDKITSAQFQKLAEVSSRATFYRYIKLYEESLKIKRSVTQTTIKKLDN